MKNTVQKLDRIEKKTLAEIVTLLTIYREVLLSIIDVGPITPWELFNTLCTGMSVAEFNEILFKAIGKTSDFVQEDFNEKICLTYENSKEVRAWKEKTDKQNLERKGYPVTTYSYIFPPISTRPPLVRAPVKKLVR